MVSAKYHKFHSEFLSYSQDDRDKAIWQFLDERQACPHCGTTSKEWDETAGGHRAAYVAVLRECAGCVVKHRGERDHEVELREFPGTWVSLVRNEEVPGEGPDRVG